MKLVFLSLYLATIVVVSFLTSRKVKTLNEFHLGGRNVGPWLSAFAYGTTYFSAVIFVGYAGKLGWGFGTAATWIGIGNALIGAALAWAVLGNKTREMTQRIGATTMPEFFEKRFGSKALKIAAALVIFIFLVPYSASVYQGLGLLFEHTFGLPLEVCMIIMASFTLIAVFLGGYLSSAIIDFVQGIVMLFGVVMMMVFLFRHMGGVSAGMDALRAIDPKLTSVFGADPKNLIWMVCLTSFGVWGLPQMVHKFYAIKDKQSVKIGMIVSTVFALIIGGCAYFAGAFSRVVLAISDPAAVGGVDALVPNMLFAAMPEWMLGLIIVLVLSASMSTLQSLVMVSSSAISIDLVKGVFKPDMSDKACKGLMRALFVVFILASLAIAWSNIAEIVTLMSMSWGTVAGCIMGPYIYGVTCRRTTKAGAVCGFFSGLIVAIVLTVLLGTGKAPFTGCMSMLASMVVTPIASLITPKMPESLLHNAFGK